MWEGPLGRRSFYLQLHIKPDSVLFRGALIIPTQIGGP